MEEVEEVVVEEQIQVHPKDSQPQQCFPSPEFSEELLDVHSRCLSVEFRYFDWRDEVEEGQGETGETGAQVSGVEVGFLVVGEQLMVEGS